MRILLTGSKGFVGSHLVKILTAHQVFCLDKEDGNDLLTCDLNYDVDLVIHLAGASGLRYSLENPKYYWDNNVMATKRLFDHFKGTRIIYASSSTAKEPARNPYGMTKHLMERIAPQTSLGLRFCTIYSNSQQRPKMFIPRLLRNEISYINTNHKRDFIHIDDICSAISFLMNRDVTGVMDIGTGAAVKEAGMHEKVFLATSGGGGKTGCDNLKNDIFDVFVSYDVPGQARDLSNVVKSLLQSGNKPGKAGKVSLFTQLQTLTKDNMASYMGSGACWTVESLASN